jgi:hypothetical protein
LIDQPIEEPADQHQGTVHTGDRLPLVPTQAIPKVNDISKRDPLYREGFSIRLGEPDGKLP